MGILAFSEGIGHQMKGSVKLLGDNQGANALAKSPEYHGCTKHIHGRQRFISVKQIVREVEYVRQHGNGDIDKHWQET